MLLNDFVRTKSLSDTLFGILTNALSMEAALPAIHEHREADLSRDQRRAIAALLDSVWPREHETLDELIDVFFGAAHRNQPEGRSATQVGLRRFVVWEGNRAVAHAKTFQRTIFTDLGPIDVMALAGVCVAPTHRGSGLGVAISRKALAQVDWGDFSVSLFQTLVPGFYEKQGARVVHNPFINSKNKQDPDASPWADAHVMIYPRHYPWPDGVIDLNGSGY